MREKPKDPGRLEHILMAIDNVASFLEGKTLRDLQTDKMLFFAVVKNIEIIGEATNNITKELRIQYPEIDWVAIIGMRHVLVHDYYNIDAETAWKTATKELPSLRPQIAAILGELSENQ